MDATECCLTSRSGAPEHLEGAELRWLSLQGSIQQDEYGLCLQKCVCVYIKSILTLKTTFLRACSALSSGLGLATEGAQGLGR